MLYILSQVGLIILAIVILVTIHELGHFWAARMFGIKVETFSIFFPPKIWGFKWGETEWQIGCIPLGGFVKISGMIDESMDEEQMKAPIQPWEFRSKPVWQRAIVMLGGIIMNVLLGFVIFIGLKFFVGDDKIPVANVKHGIYVSDSTAGYYLGLRTGDKILTYKGDSVEFIDRLMDPNFLVDRNKVIEVDRGGKKVSISIPNDYLRTFQNLKPEEQSLFQPDGPAEIVVLDSIPNEETKKFEKSPAFLAGLDSADVIVRIDSVPTPLWSDVKKYIYHKPNQEMTFVVMRKGEEKEFKVKTNKQSQVGIRINLDPYIKHIDYSFAGALIAGPSQAMRQVSNTLKGLWAVITGNSDRSKSLNSFIKISQVMKVHYDRSGWVSFWQLTAMLSMVLAVMNLLPIPALDGGHVVFLMIEAITGREPSLKVRMIAQQVGMVLLLSLMAYIIIKDIVTY